jgi:hypothetical protein
MSGDMSVTTSSGSDNYNTATHDFQGACVRAEGQQNVGGGQATSTSSNSSSSSASSASSASGATTLLPPGVSVEGAADSVNKGGALLTTPEPPTRTVDQRIAWNEQWLARTEAFFKDPGIMSFLDTAQVAQLKADLKSYRDQLTAFKALVAKYRSEGKEPSADEIKAAFCGMREVRRDLKGLIGVVMLGITKLIISMVETAHDSITLLHASSLALNVVSYGAQYMSIIGDTSKTELEEARELPFLLRGAFFRLRDMREFHPS